MKILTGTLLLTFSVLFNSIELSSQSNNNRGNGNTSPPPEELETITIPNLPSGQAIVLPNGNYYVSRGTGHITIIYDSRTQVGMVGQAGFPVAYVGPRSTFRRTRTRTSFNNQAENHARGRQQPPPNGQ